MNVMANALTIRETPVAVMSMIEMSIKDDLIGMIADTDLIQHKKAMITADHLVPALMTAIAPPMSVADIQEIEGIMTGNMKIVHEIRNRDILNSMITTVNVPIEMVTHILLVDNMAIRKKTQKLTSLAVTQGLTNKMSLLPMTSLLADQEVIVLRLLMRTRRQVAQKSEVMNQLLAMKTNRIPSAPRESIELAVKDTH